MTVQVVQMFAPTVLTTSAATLFTNNLGSPVSVFTRGRIRFTNTSGSLATVTAYAVPSGGGAGAGNTFCPGLAVQAGSSLDVDVPVLANGAFVQALASAASAVTAQAMDGVLFT